MKNCYKCKTIKPLDQFNKNKSKPDGLQWICKDCNRKRSRSYYKANAAKCIKVNHQRRKILSIQCNEIVLNWKSKGCIICKEDCEAAIDAHHIDSKTKDDTISNCVSKGKLKKLKTELQKCIPLCANCHRKLHHGYLSLVN